jgi:hypothetical protein
MACSEIDSAIDWAKQASDKGTPAVTAYFTRHTGASTDPNAPTTGSGRDFCWYAVGDVQYTDSPGPGHLKGNIQLSLTAATGEMKTSPKSTLMLEIFPDGTVTFQQRINGKPVGGMPPVTVVTNCVGGVLLTGVEGNSVVAVGVRRDPIIPIPK